MALIAHYKLNETNGSGAGSVLDASGNGYHATPVRALSSTTVAGKVSTAWSGDGTGDKITLPDAAAFDFGTGTVDAPLTFAAWLRCADARYHTIFARYDTHATFGQYVWRVAADGSFGIALYDGQSNTNRGKFTAAAAVGVGTWHHLAVTYDGRGGTNAQDGIKLYINGSEASYAAYVGPGTYVAMENTAAVPVIGYHFNNGFARLALDDFRIYNDVQSLAQIVAIYNGGNGTELPYPAIRKPSMGMNAIGMPSTAL